MTATASKSRPFPLALAALSSLFSLALTGCSGTRDESDYRRLWKTPEAFCRRYLSRHQDPAKIPLKDVAAFNLGICAENGWGMPENKVDAANWYLAAGKEGNSNAQMRLIDLGLQGIPEVRPQVQELSDFLTKPIIGSYRTRAIDMESIYQLGLLHDSETSGLTDHRRALICFAYAAYQDHPGANYQIGLQELKKGGRFCRSAYRYFSRAARLGHADALAQLGILLWTELSQLKDLDEAKEDAAPQVTVERRQAISKLMQAAESGSALAIGYLGLLYATVEAPIQVPLMRRQKAPQPPKKQDQQLAKMDAQSRKLASEMLGLPPPVPENFIYFSRAPVKAREYLEKAASMGDEPAELTLGAFLVDNELLLPKDVQRGLEILQRHSDKGDETAIFKLGEAYLSGRPDIPANPEEGVRLLTLSAEKKNRKAPRLLAELYESGKGVLPQNSALAIKWHEKSALAGVGASAMRLGKIYENGELGQARDLEKALSWYEKAFKLGENGAAYRCGVVARLTGQKARIAADYLSWSSQKQHAFEAGLELAEMYVRGEAESGRDVDKAWEWAADIFDRDRDPRGICAVSCMLLGLPGPWDDVVPEQLAGNSNEAEQKAYARMNQAQRREFLRKRGMGHQTKDADDAVKMLQHASEKGFREASMLLVHIYGTGIHVQASESEADEYRRKLKYQGEDVRHPPLFPKFPFDIEPHESGNNRR